MIKCSSILGPKTLIEVPHLDHMGYKTYWPLLTTLGLIVFKQTSIRLKMAHPFFVEYEVLQEIDEIKYWSVQDENLIKG